ncbi:MAG: BatD family protein, partial [Chitinophagaceae bacterium]
IKLPYPPQPSIEDVNGVPFKVFVIRKTMLFPLQSGRLELDPAEVDNTVRLYQVERQRHDNDPFDNMMNDPFFKSVIGNDPFFQQAFGGSDVSYHDYDYNTSSAPVTVDVNSLPEAGKPADFTGAVGNYTMNASLDKTKFSTNDAATLKIIISGTGNISLLSAPQVDLASDFDNYTPTVTDNINSNSNPYGGSRTFTYVLMPKTAGDFTIPPVQFSYFDPAAEKYKTIETSAFTLDITPGSNKGGNPINYTSEGNSVLQPIRNGRLAWSKGGLLRFGTWWYWLLLIIPLAILIVLYLLKRRNDSLQSNQALLKNKRANRVALKRLSLANQFLQQNKPKEFYGEISQAVWGYLCDKFNIPFAELSKQKAQEKLIEKQVNGHTPEKLFELLDNCEVALYAGSEGQEQMKATYQDAVEVVTHLEEQFKKS